MTASTPKPGPRCWPRRFLVLTASLTLCLLVLVNGCAGWLAKSIVWGPNTDKHIDASHDAAAETLASLGVHRQMRVDAAGPPPASLSLWLIDPSTTGDGAAVAPLGTLLVLHGINDRKDTMVPLGRRFAERGYRVVLVDLRAHGRSSGQWLTFGVHESRDLSQVLDALSSQGLLAGDVGVFGPSFGGGIAIQFAGRDDRVKAVVSVCGFTSMRDVTPGVVRMYAPVVGRLLLDSTVQRAVTQAGRVAGFDPDDASALDAIRRTKARVLLIHGNKDVKIPPRHSRRLHEAAPDRGRLLLLDEHDHDSILAGDSAGVVFGESVAWFDQWLGQK